jgi:competence protein ComEA
MLTGSRNLAALLLVAAGAWAQGADVPGKLESGLSLARSQAAAIVRYRTQHGDFKSIEDLKRVPGVDVAKIEAKKDRLLF